MLSEFRTSDTSIAKDYRVQGRFKPIGDPGPLDIYIFNEEELVAKDYFFFTNW